MTARFTDRVVLITGASSGIGKAVALRVANEGATVVLGSRDKDTGEATAAELRAIGSKALFVPTDVTVDADMAALTAAAVSEFGRLDAAFNNAGAITAFGPVSASDPTGVATDGWQAEIALNLTSVYYGVRHQVPALLASGGGAILNNASNLGMVGMAGLAPYSAAKHGVIGLTKSTAMENAEHGIRVNALVSGAVDTPAFRATTGATPEGKAGIVALHPMGRLGTPEEIATLCAYLLSTEASFVTGAALAIDGGFTAR
ncbi:SDR family NAD(P)-dependent oxidoreductase [Nocardia callitridis]|uniref:3-oxoacyl-[acyl-carrier-protein] reductase MabA n=1 Tax=Nocardia callitridis TaxID=648753 RepID=A0ABP9KZS5_9NOCA